MDPHRHPDRRVPRPGEAVEPGAAASRYPPWRGERLSLAEARDRGAGRVAGRFYRGRTRDLLEDPSAVVEIARAFPRPGHGDQVAGRLAAGEGGLELRDVEVVAPALRELPPELREVAARRPALEARARVLGALRAWFNERGFLEVETPTRVVNPGLEPHLRPFPAGVGPEGLERWLITSPELHLKRLLAAGYERIYEIARTFRDDERGSLHASEFTLLEWYRSHAGLDDLAADLAALLPCLARAAGREPAEAVKDVDLRLPPRRVSYRGAFLEHAGRDPAGLEPAERERLFVSRVEPRLGWGRPLLLGEFPPEGAALARLVRPAEPGGWPRVAARLELYIAGVELANGFDELNDPVEQRLRHQAEREARHRAARPAPPLDEGFLAALEAGMAPAAGMALGVDRLVMLLLGAGSVGAVRAFSG